MAEKKPSDFYDMYRDENTSFAKEYHERISVKEKKRISNAQVFTTRFFIILLICGLGAALFGTLYFGSFGNKVDPLSFDVEGPQAVKSGDSITYELPIKNRGSVPLADLSVSVEYPQGFHFDSASVDSNNVDHTYWKLPSIKAGESTILSIHGTLVGNESDEKKLRATLHYRVGENGTEFVSKKEFTSHIASQLISLSLDGDTVAEPEKEMKFTITYGDIESIGDESNAFIAIHTPKQFHFESDPKPEEDGSWPYSILKKNFDQSKRMGIITLKGTFDKDVSGEYEISVDMGTLKNGETIITQTLKKTIRILHNPLTLTVVLNDSAEIKPVSFGSEMKIAIQYANNSANDLKNTSITLTSPSPIIDWSSYKSDSMGIVADQAINWTKKEFPPFETIKAGEKGEIIVSLKTKEASTLSQSSLPKSFSFITNASMTYSYDNNDFDAKNEALTTEIPLSSDARIYVSAQKTDIPNQFTVRCDIENTLNEIKNIKVVLPLGSSASWIEKYTRSAGDISYDEANNTVTWTLNRLPLSIHAIHSSFTVAFPGAKDLSDTTLELMQTGTFNAVDTKTQGSISLKLPSLTIGDSAQSKEAH